MMTLYDAAMQWLNNPQPRYPASVVNQDSERRAYVRTRAESPIEASLGQSLIDSWKFVIVGRDDVGFRLAKNEIAFVMQYPVANHRIDMGLFFRTLKGDPVKVAVECDGKQFHEGLENERKDAIRDNKLRAAGFRVWRYPGWLLHHHAYVAANEIQHAANDIIMGRTPILTFTRQRARKSPTLNELMRAYWANVDGVPWPARMGAKPHERGWRHVEDIQEWAYYEGQSEFPDLYADFDDIEDEDAA
jgi:very-short-patch-repair endonuclease